MAAWLRWSQGEPSPPQQLHFALLASLCSSFSNGKKIPNHIVINQRECDEYYSICTPALVSCCFVWVSQTVTMTTASSYWTDVICDIMLNGKKRKKRHDQKYKEWNKTCFLLFSSLLPSRVLGDGCTGAAGKLEQLWC